MQDDPEAIAARLTGEEREAVLFPDVDTTYGVSASGAQFNPPYRHIRKLPQLIEVGRFGKRAGYRCRLTPLGIKVRAFLVDPRKDTDQ